MNQSIPDTPRSCWNCAHFKTVQLDLEVKWVRCTRGRCLIAREKLIRPHHLFNDPAERIILTTVDGWTSFGGNGPAMLGAPACADWEAA